MELRDLGKTPVSPENPAGEDVRFDNEYEDLQQEIDKLSIATAGGGADWEKIVRLSSSILEKKSKNILVACYLSVGLLNTRQIEGFEDGLIILKDLVENFWDSLFPPVKRMRGRLNALSWWMDRIEAYLKGYQAEPLSEATVKSLQANLDALDKTVSGKSDEAPVIHRIRDYVDRLPVQPKEGPPTKEAPKAAAAPPAASPAKPAAAPKAAPAPAAPAGEPQSDKDVKKLLDFGLQQLSKVAGYLMKQDPSSALAYRLTRIAAWLTVDLLPPAEKGKTLIPPPDSLIKSSIENLLAGRDYEGAARSAESRIIQFLFWLDLSRLTAQALDELGGKYRPAYDAVCTETALYVQRLPGIENLAFSDGTPFADQETRAWLKNIALGSGGGPALAVGGGESEKEVAETFDKAQKLLRDKKRLEAVKLLQDRLQAGGSGKERLLWRIAMVRLLMLTGKNAPVRPHLESILNDIGGFRLEEWDPALALAGLRAVYDGMLEEKDEEAKAAARAALDRISRISPAEALQILGKA